MFLIEECVYLLPCHKRAQGKFLGNLTILGKFWCVSKHVYGVCLGKFIELNLSFMSFSSRLIIISRDKLDFGIVN